MPKKLLSKLLNRQVISFVIVGGICYFIGISLLMFFVELVKLEINLANLISSIITIFICYLLNVKFVFQGGRYKRTKEIFTFYIFSFFGLLLNITLIYFMTKYLPIWYVISKTIVILIVAVFNFTTRKKFVFLQ